MFHSNIHSTYVSNTLLFYNVILNSVKMGKMSPLVCAWPVSLHVINEFVVKCIIVTNVSFLCLIQCVLINLLVWFGTGFRDWVPKELQRVGCVELLNTVQQRVQPKLHAFGGIHEGEYSVPCPP